MRVLLALGPNSLPRLETIKLDLTTLSFTFGISIITGLLFGLAPVLQTRKWNWQESLKESTRGSSAGRSRVNARRMLVISEVALALVLLVGGGLMVRSFARLRAVDPGFNPDNLLTLTISLAGSAHNTPPKRIAFFNELSQRVNSLPGVQAASAINHLPLAGDMWTIPFTIEGRPAPAPGEKQSAVSRVIRPDYFRTMGATLLKGRDFTMYDTDTTPPVAIINEPFAKRHWPNEDPIGKRIQISDDESPREIVGVVKALKQDQWTTEPNLEMYAPHLQSPFPRALTLVVRSTGDPTALVGAIENQVWAIDKNLPVAEIRTMQEVVTGSIEQHRFNLFLLGLFAAVALLLAVVGIYGVMSESVSSRTHEIGVRMALGAQRADVLRMVVRQGMSLAVIGIAIGLFGAFWVTQFMSKLLYEVSPTDSATFLLIPLALAVVVLCACLIPARRATKVDPLVALRYE